MTRNHLLAGAASMLLLACTPDTPAEHTFELTVVQRYGMEELGADSLEMPEALRRAGSGVLTDVRGIVQTEDSTVYVLDRDFYKIVGFAPDGRVREFLLGGYGEGPGEFNLPVHMARMPDGDLVVADFELRRLSYFRPGSGFVSMARVETVAPMRLLPLGDVSG